MAKHKLVVKPHQPKRLGVIVAVALVFTVGLAFLMYEYGRYRGGYDGRDARETELRLNQQLNAASEANVGLREKIALLETSKDVDREAYSQVETTLGDLQQQIQQQKEELAFYRGIIAPEDGKRGLKIQEFALSPAGAESEFRMRLVLVQAAAKQDRRISGSVKMSIEGARNGAQTSYDIKELLSETESGGPMLFSFRYFQNLEKNVVLPNGFVPQRVNVEVSPKGRTADVIKRSFEWAVKSS